VINVDRTAFNHRSLESLSKGLIAFNTHTTVNILSSMQNACQKNLLIRLMKEDRALEN
jgi:hypothetical protein